MVYLILLGISVFFTLIAYFLSRYLCGLNCDEAIKLTIIVVTIGSVFGLIQLAFEGFFNAI